VCVCVCVCGLFRARMTLNIVVYETVLEENIKYETLNYCILYNELICCDNDNCDNSLKQETLFSVTKCNTVEFILLVKNQKKDGG
jgi:hypothetical protein